MDASDQPYKSHRVYFARAIDGQNRQTIRALASTVARELEAVGLHMVDPTLTEPIASSGQQLASYANYHRAIVDHDLSVLRTCHAVLMDMTIPNRNYIGCTCEMVYAYLWGIPCITYTGENESNRPWLLYHSVAVHRLRESAIKHLAVLLGSVS